ncbi:hypothetical protein [Streptomyces sp. NPDC097981]|uniref:hypothetical protein n=1 Tax=Streptomyces sp. NPDC097981 TaxID=3155428 RepID=UPI00332AC7DE
MSETEQDTPAELLPYEELTRPEFAETAAATFTAEQLSSAILLQGPCPRCRTPIEVHLLEQVVGRGEPAQPAAEPKTIFCTCTDPHPNRPESRRSGCGAYWTLVLNRARG